MTSRKFQPVTRISSQKDLLSRFLVFFDCFRWRDSFGLTELNHTTGLVTLPAVAGKT